MFSRLAAVSSSLRLALGLGPALVLVAASGCSDNSPIVSPPDGGDGAAAGMDSAVAGPGCPDTGGLVDPTTLIDDFEDSDPNLPMIAGRGGGWFASGDGTPGAIMQPMGLAKPEPIPGGRCGSRHALHVTGSGFNDWGSIVSVALRDGVNSAGVYQETPYDALARGYQGITFFARIGETASNTVRFATADEYARPEAGLCTVDGAPGKTCYDTYGVPLGHELETQWKQFRIPWTGMAQQSFGLPGGPTPDTSKLYDISFNFPGRVVFDLWVDDVSFF